MKATALIAILKAISDAEDVPCSVPQAGVLQMGGFRLHFPVPPAMPIAPRIAPFELEQFDKFDDTKFFKPI